MIKPNLKVKEEPHIKTIFCCFVCIKSNKKKYTINLSLILTVLVSFDSYNLLN